MDEAKAQSHCMYFVHKNSKLNIIPGQEQRAYAEKYLWGEGEAERLTRARPVGFKH